MRLAVWELRSYLNVRCCADWREAVRIIFGVDPDREPERARMVHDSHLARARWMTQAGYRNLLRPRPQ